jgi:hypothetical protein
MKEKLMMKLKLPDIDRKFKWFWANYVRANNSITYSHFMNMLDGNTPMRDDVKETIETYLGA